MPAFGGYMCAQLYYKSKYIALYPMTTVSQGPDTLEDLCRDRGAPIKLKNDRAQIEIGKTWTATHIKLSNVPWWLTCNGRMRQKDTYRRSRR